VERKYNMKISGKKVAVILVVLLAILAPIFWQLFLTVPKNFPSGSMVKIEKGLSLSRVSSGLEKSGIIKQKWAFYFLARLSGKADEIKYGDYVFKEPLSVLGVMKKITRGDFGVKPVKVIILEGSISGDIAEVFEDFENFDKDVFLKKTKELEGYLFPDTYFFSPGVETEEIIKTMTDNFKNKVGETNRDTVIMASLIEKEAPAGDDRKIISGILWKRLEIGMPLQVDAVFPYITGKKGEKVLLDDLKIDSPYNTYLNKGLPPGPIGNPGLDAIDAALRPKESPYLYYLHGKNGKTYFAKTFAEHLRNKEKYLR